MGPKLWNTGFGAGSPEQLGLGSHKTTGPGEVNERKQKNKNKRLPLKISLQSKIPKQTAKSNMELNYR